MATSTRLTQIQLQDGTSLSGQDCDAAVQDVAAATNPDAATPQTIAMQRNRGPHRLVRTMTPQVSVTPMGPPYLRAKNFSVVTAQPVTVVSNEYRFHGYEVPGINPASTGPANQQYALSTQVFYDVPAELTRFSATLLIDSVRLATFLYGGAIATRTLGTWVDNVVLCIEVQDPFAVNPGMARYQTPVILKKDFRLSGWSLLSPSGAIAAGVETSVPPWPGSGGSMPSGVCIEVETSVAIPAQSRVTFALLLPSGSSGGFVDNLPFANVETTATIEWATECQE
jgi:hypothetical protein